MNYLILDKEFCVYIIMLTIYYYIYKVYHFNYEKINMYSCFWRSICISSSHDFNDFICGFKAHLIKSFLKVGKLFNVNYYTLLQRLLLFQDKLNCRLAFVFFILELFFQFSLFPLNFLIMIWICTLLLILLYLLYSCLFFQFSIFPFNLLLEVFY